MDLLKMVKFIKALPPDQIKPELQKKILELTEILESKSTEELLPIRDKIVSILDTVLAFPNINSILKKWF